MDADILIKYEIFLKDADASLCLKKKAESFYMVLFSITLVFADIEFEQEVQLILKSLRIYRLDIDETTQKVVWS